MVLFFISFLFSLTGFNLRTVIGFAYGRGMGGRVIFFITNPGRGTAGKYRNSCFFFFFFTHYL